MDKVRALHLGNAELGVDGRVHAEKATMHAAPLRIRCVSSGLGPGVRAACRVLRGRRLVMVVAQCKRGGHNHAETNYRRMLHRNFRHHEFSRQPKLHSQWQNPCRTLPQLARSFLENDLTPPGRPRSWRPSPAWAFGARLAKAAPGEGIRKTARIVCLRQRLRLR
jgi:hypothetical protein